MRAAILLARAYTQPIETPRQSRHRWIAPLDFSAAWRLGSSPSILCTLSDSLYN